MEKAKKKIAVVIPKYGLLGGAELFAARLTERLAANPELEFHILANQWNQEKSEALTFHKIPHVRFPRFLTTLSFAFFAERFLTCHAFDLVHSHDRIFHADIFTLHGIPHEIWVRNIRKKRRMSLFDRSTAWMDQQAIHGNPDSLLAPVSSLTGEIYMQKFNLNPERIKVIHPGIDPGLFHKDDFQKARDQINRKFGISPDELLLLFVSMNYELKGLDGILRAVSALNDRSVKLLVVGKGNENKYRKIAGQSGLAGQVVFAGVQDYTEVIRLYQVADVFMMPSNFDAFGISVVEAMAASCPVIIAKTVGARDIVSDGINGFIVENEFETEAMVHCLRKLKSAELRRTMGLRAREAALAMTWGRTATQYADLYQSILSARQKGS